MRKSETLDMDLTSILQVLEVEKARGSLSVTLGEQLTRIIFKQGIVIDTDPRNISIEDTLEEFLNSDRLHRQVSLECEHQNIACDKDEPIPAVPDNGKPSIIDLDIPSIFRVFDINNGKGILSINYNDFHTKIFIEDGTISHMEPDHISMEEIIEEYIRNTELKQNAGFSCKIYSNGDEPKEIGGGNSNLRVLPVSDFNKNPKPEQDEKMDKNTKLSSPGHLIDIIRNDLGNAVITANIWRSSNESVISSFRKEPNLVKLFNKISKNLITSLKKSVLPNQNGYYLVSLEDKQYALILPLGDFQMGLILDSTKVEIGLVLNVTLPKIMQAFDEMKFKQKEVV